MAGKGGEGERREWEGRGEEGREGKGWDLPDQCEIASYMPARCSQETTESFICIILQLYY